MRVLPNITKYWTVHHDNLPAHAALSVAQLLIKCNTVMAQPPYSTRILRILFFFQKAKSAVKGHHFETTEDIQRSVTQDLKDIPHAAYQEYYNQWQHCWKSCVQAQGVYFEGDHILVDGKKKEKLFWNQSHYFIVRRRIRRG